MSPHLRMAQAIDPNRASRKKASSSANGSVPSSTSVMVTRKSVIRSGISEAWNNRPEHDEAQDQPERGDGPEDRRHLEHCPCVDLSDDAANSPDFGHDELPEWSWASVGRDSEIPTPSTAQRFLCDVAAQLCVSEVVCSLVRGWVVCSPFGGTGLRQRAMGASCDSIARRPPDRPVTRCRPGAPTADRTCGGRSVPPERGQTIDLHLKVCRRVVVVELLKPHWGSRVRRVVPCVAGGGTSFAPPVRGWVVCSPFGERACVSKPWGRRKTASSQRAR